MSKSPKPGFHELAKESSMYHPQEALLKVSSKQEKLIIGIPRETAWQENRIPLIPENISVLVNNGHEIILESQAGSGAKYTDHEYSEAGAKVTDNPKEVFGAEIILKVQPPTLEEIKMINPGKFLISTLQLANSEKNFFLKLAEKKITAIALENIKDKAGSQPVVTAMSEIAGNSSMIIAAENLASSKNGMGVILGGITGVAPTQVVILGAGTVAEFAARSAIGLGANVKIFDNRLYRLRRLKHNLSSQVFTSTIDTATLSNAISQADVVIGALRASHGRTPLVVSEEMVMEMKPNSVIVDISIDHGGCFETSAVTSHKSPTFRKYDVIHYCVPNIPSRVPRTASTAFSNILTPYFITASKFGGINEMISAFKWFRNGVYLFKGMFSDEDICDQYKFTYRDLDLLLAAQV
jgi:alanine dehydrogenase